VRGQRFVQTSLLLQPGGANHPWRALPVHFTHAPVPKVPAHATEEQEAALKELRKKHRLSLVALEQVRTLRAHIDATPGGYGRILVNAVDGGYLARWELEVNFRKDKSVVGVGQAQVRVPQAVQRAPQFQASCYATLLWCSITVLGTSAPRPSDPCRAGGGRRRSALRRRICCDCSEPK
jgi:hypothetical protein